MTKRDLVVRIARQTGLRQRDVRIAVQKALDIITDELAANRGLEFRNFGVFQVTTRKARVGRNPTKPEQTVKIPERKIVKFKPGKIMREKITGC